MPIPKKGNLAWHGLDKGAPKAYILKAWLPAYY